MNKLILFIGIPGSGKSRATKSYPDAYIVCPDNIRKDFFKDINDQSNNIRVWDIAKGKITAALELGKDVILDATNVNTIHRRNLLADIKSMIKCSIEAVLFEVSPETAFSRISSDISKGISRCNVPLDIIYRMYGEYLYTEKILQEESFSKITYFSEAL